MAILDIKTDFQLVFNYMAGNTYHMDDDSTDVIDEVNSLLKLGVGDSYRLEHIKQAYIKNKTIWITDKNYLKRLRDKYLTKHTPHPDVQLDSENIVFENEPENDEKFYCWKCGKKSSLNANFCLVCGTSLFEVNSNSQSKSKSKSSKLSRHKRSSPLKIPIIVGIPILILVILGVGYTQGYFDNFLNGISGVDDPSAGIDDRDLGCGLGTKYDSAKDTCILIPKKDAASNSKCGAGTVYDPTSNRCIIG